MYVCREIIKALYADGEFEEIRQAVESRQLTDSGLSFFKTIEPEIMGVIGYNSNTQAEFIKVA